MPKITTVNKDNVKKQHLSKEVRRSSNDWLKDFVNPPMIYRSVPFWSWNETMEADEICRQLRLMANAGMGGGFVHSRIGLTTPYLSKQWFESVDAAIEEARRLGLKVWLYDEDKWPSGFSGGTVPLADKSYRMKALVARPIETSWPDGTDVEPVGRPFEGLQVYKWTVPLGHDWFNGTCYSDLMSRSAMRCFIDHAYEPYHKRYGADYGRLILAEFTDEPCTLFRGRILAGAVPYTNELFDCFRRMHEYDPTEKLALLFIDKKGAERFRLDYFRTVNHLFENNFSKQLGAWCSEHGIEFTGHYMCEHNLYDQQLWGVKIMPNYHHQGVPGIDHLGRQIDERISAKQCHSVVNQYGKKRMLSELYGCSGQNLSFEDRLWIASQQICLGANLLNEHLLLYTMAGCRKRDYPPNLFYQQPWWPINNEINEPLSRLCVALSQGKYHAEALIIHPQESVFALWKSKWQTQENGLIGRNGLWDWEPTDKSVKENVNQLDVQVKAVMNVLLGSQHTFDFGDETIMAEAGEVVIIDSRPYLRIGRMDYPVVILPSMITIAASSVELLKKFQQAGGIIFCCGRKPQLLDGQISSELEQWLKQVPEVGLSELPAKVRNSVIPAVELADVNVSDAGMLWSHVRNLENGERLVFLTNLERMAEIDVTVNFPGGWKSAYLLDFWTGRRKKITVQKEQHGIRAGLFFSPAQNHLLLLSPEHNSEEIEESSVFCRTNQIVKIPADEWQVERLDDNAITLDYAYWRESEGKWSSAPAPVVAIQKWLNELKYDGPLTLRYSVAVKKLAQAHKVKLVVEHPERYHIMVNGRAVKYTGLPFWRDIRWLPIDITGKLHEGQNTIEMHCDKFQHGDLTNARDQKTRYGTEIESVYLVGDFSVVGELLDDKPVSPQWKEFGLPPVKVRCFRESSFYVTNPRPLSLGDTAIQGLPFYAGRIQLKAKVPAIDSNNLKSVRLCIERLDAAAAEVFVDDKKTGIFISHPFEVDLTEAVFGGGSEITIILYGTLRNLLGPHHHIDGELATVAPEHFLPGFGENDYASSVMRWMDDRKEPPDWRNSYCMVSFGELEKIYIVNCGEKNDSSER